MKKLIIALGLVFILLFAWVVPASAYPGGQNFAAIEYQVGTGTLSYELVLGNSNPPVIIGNVTVSSDANSLYVQYNITGAYALMETHLGVASGITKTLALNKFEGINSVAGLGTNTAVGYWGGSIQHSSPFDVKTEPYTIPLSVFTDLTEGWLKIAAHAKIAAYNGTTEVGSAWAEGLGTRPVGSVPELPAAALFGIGLAGIGAFIFIRRRRSTVSTR
jgi:hypothetical protein